MLIRQVSVSDGSVHLFFFFMMHVLVCREILSLIFFFYFQRLFENMEWVINLKTKVSFGDAWRGVCELCSDWHVGFMESSIFHPVSVAVNPDWIHGRHMQDVSLPRSHYKTIKCFVSSADLLPVWTRHVKPALLYICIFSFFFAMTRKI